LADAKVYAPPSAQSGVETLHFHQHFRYGMWRSECSENIAAAAARVRMSMKVLKKILHWLYQNSWATV
jgi:hypothetical protein